MSWHPHVTVATIVEDQGRFLLVEEQADGREVLNQPAGHLEPPKACSRPHCAKPSRKPAGRSS